jgi:hypothetical protein
LINRFFRKNNGKLKLSGILFIVVILIIISWSIWWPIFFGLKKSFTFQSYGEVWQAQSSTAPTIIEGFFDGNVTNNSNEKRTLEKITYVVWKDRTLGSAYNYGWLLGDNNFFEYIGDGQKRTSTLPLLFQESEAKRLGIGFKIDVETPEEMALWNQENCKGVFCWHKNNVELLFEDSKGNTFDKDGNLISSDVIDSWWTLPNDKNLSDKFSAKFNLFINIIIWKFDNFFHIIK